MSENSTIEWTDTTWNPLRGCDKISTGCMHCYAETWAERFRGVPNHPFEFGFDLRLAPHKLLEPFRWTKPQLVFVNSMSDLFHKDVSDDYIIAVVNVMAKSNWHTYQLLTKRSERLRDLLKTKLAFAARLQHIWWGVSVEDRRFGVPRIDHLRDAGAAMAFLSVEPLLEDLGKINLDSINWVIVGGESGPGARPMEKEWVIDIRDQCLSSTVPFFFKQWGGVRKKQTGRLLEGQTYDEFPAIVREPIPDLKVRKSIIAELRYLETQWAAVPVIA